VYYNAESAVIYANLISFTVVSFAELLGWASNTWHIYQVIGEGRKHPEQSRPGYVVSMQIQSESDR